MQLSALLGRTGAVGGRREFVRQLLRLPDFGAGPLVITGTNGIALTGGSY